MKKIIITLALVGMLVAPSVFAEHLIYDAGGTKVIGSITDKAWNEAITASQLQGAEKLPVFPPNTSVVDEHGIVLTCYWFMATGCQDPTHSQVYRTAMQKLARELIRIGWAPFFPLYSGWVESVR